MCKRFDLEPAKWAIAKVVAALAVCLAAYSATVPAVTGAMQKDASSPNSGQPSSAPVITATPDRVTVSGGHGSTDIRWDRGDGSVGFVFVTENARKAVLFATGPRGSRVAPWIRAGRYFFELYGDADRRTLLARVTVSGSVQSGAPQRRTFWPDVARLLLVLAVGAVLYFAVYLGSTGTLRTTFPTEPTTSPHPLHVGRNFFLGVAAFICVDGVIFHTGFYTSILAPDSYAGRLALLTRAENQRAPSGLKEVLVLGDSRMAEGFSTAVADTVGSAAGLEFVNLAEAASSVNNWYYMLREVDPTARRYWAIVVPYGIGYEPSTADPLRISMTAPLLRYTDCFSFASGFQRWSGRFRAFAACMLRGSAYQSDVADLLAHPLARIKAVQEEPKRIRSRAAYKGRNYDIVGTTYDPQTGQITFPPQLTEAQRRAVRESLVRPPDSEIQYFLKLQRHWIPRILHRYTNSPTAIVLTPVPRGPFAEVTGFSTPTEAVFAGDVAGTTVVSVPEQTFGFLEKAEYYFDGYHLNAKGREQFTQKLVTELVGLLGSHGSDAPSGLNRKLTPATTSN